MYFLTLMLFLGVRHIKHRPVYVKKINQGAVSFVDLHLSEVAQMVNYGFFGDIDVAVIEASALAPDGRVWLTSGIGNAPTWLLRAKKVIIELNHYHDPRVAELADIVIPWRATAA